MILKMPRRGERGLDRTARIALAVAMARVDLLPHPTRAGEYKRLVLALARNSDPRGVLMAIDELTNEDAPLLAA